MDPRLLNLCTSSNRGLKATNSRVIKVNGLEAIVGSIRFSIRYIEILLSGVANMQVSSVLPPILNDRNVPSLTKPSHSRPQSFWIAHGVHVQSQSLEVTSKQDDAFSSRVQGREAKGGFHETGGELIPIYVGENVGVRTFLRTSSEQIPHSLRR